MHGRGENGITKLLISVTGKLHPHLVKTSQAHLLCPRLLSIPYICTVWVQTISMSDGTSLQNFTTDGAMFPKHSLLTILQFGPAPTLWGSVLPHNDGVLACPTNFLAIMLWQRFRYYNQLSAFPIKRFLWPCISNSSEIMANHNTQAVPGFTAFWHFIPMPVTMVVLWGPLGTLSMERLYDLHQMYAKHWNHFSPCDWWNPQPHWLFLGFHPTSQPEYSPGLSSRISNSALLCLQTVICIETLFFLHIVLGSVLCECFHSFSFSPATFRKSNFSEWFQRATLSLPFSQSSLHKNVPYPPQFLLSPPVHLSASHTWQFLWLKVCRLLWIFEIRKELCPWKNMELLPIPPIVKLVGIAQILTNELLQRNGNQMKDG